MDKKNLYHSFCQQNKNLPIFFQDWYLDAVCVDGSWDVAIVKKGHQLAGVLPYYLKQKGPFRYITMPPLTKMMGPFVANDFRAQSKFIAVCNALIEQLPHVSYYEQTFAYNIENWLPFYWKQYNQTTRYSYLLDISDLDRVYAGFSKDYRNSKIKKAESLVSITRGFSLETFYRVNKLSFDRQNKEVPYSLEFLKRLDEILEKQQARAIFFAVDKNDQIHSAAYVVWDNQCAYYLMAGDDPSLRSSGAGILLVWRIIQSINKELGLKKFDFQGSMIQNIERVRRQFGAKQVPYFLVHKNNSLLFKWISRIKNT